MTAIDSSVYFAATKMLAGAGNAQNERVARDDEVVQACAGDPALIVGGAVYTLYCIS